MKKKSKSKNYSIIIVSDAQRSNRDFVISSKLIRSFFIGLFFLSVSCGFGIYKFLTSFSENMSEQDKDLVIAQQTKTIKELTSKISHLDKSLVKMNDYKERILVAAGLKSPYALKEVGSGGGPVLNNDFNNLEGPAHLKMPDLNSNEAIIKKAKLISEKAGKIQNTLEYVNRVIDLQKVRLASTPSIWPTHGYCTDPFGSRVHPFTGKRVFHSGLDIATQLGNKIKAPANGVVLVSEYREYYGNLIIIDHKFGYTTRYGHLASFNVKEGDRVSRGDVIGFVGNTGRSTAPHLHYEIRYNGKALDPMNFIID